MQQSKTTWLFANTKTILTFESNGCVDIALLSMVSVTPLPLSRMMKHFISILLLLIVISCISVNSDEQVEMYDGYCKLVV